jgi:3'(2'), 5'-bisphosphate nucleotidase
MDHESQPLSHPSSQTFEPGLPADRHRLIQALLPVMASAGRCILDIYGTDFSVRGKADESPVTLADEAAEAIILAALRKLTPDIPIIAEEQAAAGHIPDIGDYFWLVDPLDGTKEFISRNGEFTVNIGLIEHHKPVLGLVLAPAIGRIFFGAHGTGAFSGQFDGVNIDPAYSAIHARQPPDKGAIALASRSHRDAATEALITAEGIEHFKAAGSSLKFCLLACGEADFYPRTGPTMEWDTAAGHAVLVSAGGQMHNLDGSIFAYGKPGFKNPGFIARGLVRD